MPYYKRTKHHASDNNQDYFIFEPSFKKKGESIFHIKDVSNVNILPGGGFVRQRKRR